MFLQAVFQLMTRGLLLCNNPGGHISRTRLDVNIYTPAPPPEQKNRPGLIKFSSQQSRPFLFFDVVNTGGKNGADMVVCKRVIDGLAGTSGLHQILLLQDL